MLAKNQDNVILAKNQDNITSVWDSAGGNTPWAFIRHFSGLKKNKKQSG